MTAHTPGPWHVHPIERHVVMSNDCVICEGADVYGEDQDNARLIAASPDMLAMCRAYLDGISSICGANNREAAFLEKIEDMARTAIEKVEGGS